MLARRFVRYCPPLVASLALAAHAVAQCPTALTIPTGVESVDGPVRCCVEWDPDGAGPATPRFVVGGSFSTAGTVQVQGLAVYDPADASWNALGGGLPGTTGAITTLAASPAGDLFVGGSIAIGAGSPSNNIAHWNGASWQPLGTGLDAAPRDMLVLPNGTLVVAGAFTTAGGVAVPGIAQWNGTAWSPLGAGIAGVVDVGCIAARANGNLVAGGAQAGVHNVAEWNGTAWQAIGSGVTQAVKDIAVMANGNVAIVASQVQQWNGAVWSSFDPGLLGTVNHLVSLANGDLVAGGRYFNSSTCAIWNGTAWSTIPAAIRPYLGLSCLAPATQGFLLGADLFSGDTWVAHWDGTTFLRLTSGPDPFVSAFATLPNGDVIVAGSFRRIGHLVVNGIARWDGRSWHAMGSGTNGAVGALVVMPNGDIVAGGSFTSAGGVPAIGIARWDGTNWSRMDSFFNGGLMSSGLGSFAFDRNGALIGGGNGLYRWMGTGWQLLAGGSGCGVVKLPDGDLFVAWYSGNFGNAGRWDGATYSPISTPFPIGSVAVAEDGTVYAASNTATVLVYRWTGSTWVPVGAPLNNSAWDASIVALPDGDLLVSWYEAQLDAWQMARWELPAATGPVITGSANVAARAADGSVYLGGGFVGGYSIARMASTCPAGVAALGTSCAGSAGPVTLDATRPWIGGTCRFSAAGFGANSVALWATGMPQTPQSLPAPAAAGCVLATTLDELAVQVPSNGSVDQAIHVPNAPVLIGYTVARQVADVEFDASGNIVLVASSSALALTIGAF